MDLQDFVPDETWLRSRFAGRRAVAAVTAGDGHLWRSDREIRPAAVLVPVVKRDTGLTVLFTRRTAHLHDHAGQISFPGGRAEPGDADSAQTALRETQEGIGRADDRVEVLGEQPRCITVPGYRVAPVVALVTPPLDLKLDAFEVDEVFETPLAFLLDPANHQRNHVQFDGRERYYYAIPYGQ